MLLTSFSFPFSRRETHHRSDMLQYEQYELSLLLTLEAASRLKVENEEVFSRVKLQAESMYAASPSQLALEYREMNPTDTYRRDPLMWKKCIEGFVD